MKISSLPNISWKRKKTLYIFSANIELKCQESSLDRLHPPMCSFGETSDVATSLKRNLSS